MFCRPMALQLLLVHLFFWKIIASAQYDLLFVFHDAGESLGLQPVVDSFLKDDFNISILCLGK
jgi:hypothetical protein